MHQTQRIQARIEPKLKRNAEAIFDSVGLSPSEAIRLFYKQVELFHGLPFDVRIPNPETMDAFKELDNNASTLKRHKTLTAFKKSLGI